MAATNPKNANEFIEQQLDDRAEALESSFGSHQLALIGGLVAGVDDILRNVIEDLQKRSKSRRLTFLLTTPGGYIEVVQRIVDTIRHHYRHVAFVVPNQAFSAGTVLVMSGDQILM